MEEKSFHISLPDPNDGRFDDIDDEDPMEGISIPEHFVKPQGGASGQIVSEPRGGTSAKPGSGVKGQGSSHRRMRNPYESIFGGKMSFGFADTSHSSDAEMDSFFSGASYRPMGSEPSWGDSQGFGGFSGHRKPVKETPRKKFVQPTKVEKVEPDRCSHMPTEFLMRLRSGNGLHGRGHSEKIKLVTPDTPKPEDHTRFVCVSDTHNEHDDIILPDGDVLLHCGDFTLAGRLYEVDDFNTWLANTPYKQKIVIAGNHELSFDPKIMEKVKKAKEKDSYVRFGQYLKPIEEREWRDIRSRLTNCTYLEDSEVTINGIRIWGSPWQPEFGGWGFNVQRGKEILKYWDKIPGDGIDILLTHGPPAGHGDRVVSGDRVGCVDLLNTVQLRVQPKYHLFGHIHEGYGVTTDQFTTYINCSSVNYHYEAVHEPVIFDLPNRDREDMAML